MRHSLCSRSPVKFHDRAGRPIAFPRADALIKQNEDREREYVIMSAQRGPHDKQFGSITEQLGRHEILSAMMEQLSRIEKRIDRYVFLNRPGK